MSNRGKYEPGAATGAEIRKDGDNWTLILVRDLRHPLAQYRPRLYFDGRGRLAHLL